MDGEFRPAAVAEHNGSALAYGAAGAEPIPDAGPAVQDSPEAMAHGAAGEAAPPLSREAMRQLILERLRSGQVTQEEVLADMYASIYWTEQTVRPKVAVLLEQFGAFVGSPMGQRVGRRVVKRAQRDMARAEAEAAAETATDQGVE